MYEKLRAEGFTCSYRTVERLMSEHEVRPTRKRKYKATTDSKHKLPVAPNVLGRQFTVSEPDEVWVSDITYVDTAQGWLYLCVFIDLYSRSVVGWSMATHMETSLVSEAFLMGVGKRGRAPIVEHSDRGSQYASLDFRKLLDQHGSIQSMSRKGNCWDNAVMERFFPDLKKERVWHRLYANHTEAIRDVTDYIVNFYNCRRLHSSLDYLPPNRYEIKMAEQQSIWCPKKVDRYNRYTIVLKYLNAQELAIKFLIFTISFTTKKEAASKSSCRLILK